MTEKMKKIWDRRIALGTLAIVAILYLAFFFPQSHFRHDDWILIKNYAELNWRELFTGTIVYFEEQEPWFFRPWVGLTTHVFYKLFRLNFYGWVVSCLLFAAAATVLGSLAIRHLTRSTERAILFALIFFCSFHLHFGSIGWIGEGIMNCPQLFLLALSLYFFSRWLAQEEPSLLCNVGAAVFFTLSLGSKESSLFLPLLFVGMLYHQKKLDRYRAMIPYAVICILYLIFRFTQIPMNPGYLPEKSFRAFAKPLTFFFGALAATWIAMLVAFGSASLSLIREKARESRELLPFIPFLIVLILPHLGHSFFSVGWLLLPGFFFCFSLVLSALPTEKPCYLGRVAVCSFLLTLTPLSIKLNEINWWNWGRVERQVPQLFASLPASTKEIKILHCDNHKYPRSTLSRVVGGKDHLFQMWRMYHKTTTQISILPCDVQTKDETDTVFLRWQFPDIFILVPEV